MKKLLLGLAAAATLSGAGTVFAGGGKPSVAVIEFNNETSAGWWSGGVGWELAGMVSNELAATGSFTGVFVIGGILLIVGALSYGLFVKDRSQVA